MDSSHSGRHKRSSFSAELRQQFSDLGLCDAWRKLYPQRRDYTFFSHVHRTYSRLDYAFISQSYRGLLQEAKIFPLAVSDHSLFAISLEWSGGPPPERRWYFPTTLTRDKVACNSLRESIRDFFTHNKPEDTSDFITWDAFKAVLRGHCISLSA